MIELDIKITANDLYDYLLMHNYNSPSGILGSGVGAVAVLVGMSAHNWLLLAAGIVLLLYLPWTLFLGSRKQMLVNPGFQESFHYMLDDEGIHISQGDKQESQAWENMVKAVSTGRSIIVYTSRRNATIFPKRQLGDQKDGVIAMISTHMPPSKVRIRS